MFLKRRNQIPRSFLLHWATTSIARKALRKTSKRTFKIVSECMSKTRRSIRKCKKGFVRSKEADSKRASHPEAVVQQPEQSVPMRKAKSFLKRGLKAQREFSLQEGRDVSRLSRTERR